MSTSECQVFGCLWGKRLSKISSLNLQRWNWVCEGAHGERLSQICSSDLKGWISNATANSRAYVYFHGSVLCPSHNLKNSQHLSNFEQRTLLEVVHDSGSEATSLARILFLFLRNLGCQYGAAATRRSGVTVRKKSGWSGAKWVNWKWADCKFMLKNTAHPGKNSIFERTSGPTSTSPKTTTASSTTRHKQQEIQFLHKS